PRRRCQVQSRAASTPSLRTGAQGFLAAGGAHPCTALATGVHSVVRGVPGLSAAPQRRREPIGISVLPSRPGRIRKLPGLVSFGDKAIRELGAPLTQIGHLVPRGHVPTLGEVGYPLL